MRPVAFREKDLAAHRQRTRGSDREAHRFHQCRQPIPRSFIVVGHEYFVRECSVCRSGIMPSPYRR
jgi:hypothetical protein